MNRESNILVLDEPTNHLDVDAKEELHRLLIPGRQVRNEDILKNTRHSA